jgi:hypothetical protein
MQVLLNLGSDNGSFAPRFLLRCWHDLTAFPQLHDTKAGIQIQVRVVKNPMCATLPALHNTTGSRRLRAVSVHMGGTDRSGQAHPRPKVVKRFHLLIFLDPGSGIRRWLVPDGGYLAPPLRLVLTSPSSVLGRLMLCSWGNRAMKRSLLISHAPSAPVSYHHCTRI